MAMSRPRGPGQRTARVGQVERALELHDAEIGQKMSLVMLEWHKRHIYPLEARIAFLEQPIWVRQWIIWRNRIRRLGAWLKKKVGR